MRRSLEVPRRVSVRYGPLVLRFETDEPGTRFVLRAPHDAFIVPDEHEPDCVVRCRRETPVPSSSPAEFAPDERDWELRRVPGGGDEVTYLGVTPESDSTPTLRVRFAPDYRSADASLRPRGVDDRTIPVDFPLDEYVATRLLGRRGVLALHACAVAEGDDALVFVGHSGAGKSTIAELAESAGAEVLSDDRTIVAAEPDGARAWGTPWHGSYRRGLPHSARVRGIFLLVQDVVDEVRPLHPASAFAELFVRTVQPSVEPAEVRRSVDALTSLVGMVSVSSLHFRPTAAAYRVARASALALAGAA